MAKGNSGFDSGGKGRKIQAIEVDYGGGLKSSFRLHKDGVITDIDDWTKQHNTNNLSLSEIAKRARENGYAVKTFTFSDLKNHDEERKKILKNKPDYELGYGVPWGNREYRKIARINRINSRRR